MANTKKSKAEDYFIDGEHLIDITNEQRYYYGLAPMDDSWDKEIRYSVTHNYFKRSELYFEQTTIRKIIYEEKVIIDGKCKRCYYTEIDMNVLTNERKTVIPKTSRGTERPLTTSMLLTPTFMEEQLQVKIDDKEDDSFVIACNSANDQMLPLPDASIRTKEDFEKFTINYISDLPEDYNEVLDNFRNKKRVRVKFNAGDIFRVQLTPRKYTYGLILGKVRDILKWSEVPGKHPLRAAMCQPVMYRQYDIVTDKRNITVDELQNIPLRPMDVAQDNDILWETYPIVAHKELEEKDIDLGFYFNKGNVALGFGMHDFGKDFLPEENDNYMSSYNTGLGISVTEEVPDYLLKYTKLREKVIQKLGLNEETYIDEFALKYGGITRKEFIMLVNERLP